MATGKLAPIASQPIAEDTDLLGGYSSVADITARDAIPTERRKAGMAVFVQSSGVVYQLGAGLGNGDWSVFPSGLIPPQDEAALSYTFALADVNARKRFTGATTVTATVPPFSTVAWQVGQVIYGVQYGAGVVVIAPGAGVTVNRPSVTFQAQTLEQYAQFSLIYEGSDVWTLGGTLALV